MARSGISYEDVAAVAERLSAAGTTPSHRAIRMELGTGSANTIHRHLTQWLAQRAERSAPAPSELPPDIARCITAALSAAAAAAKNASAAELARAASAADELADEGAKLEAELDALREQVRALTSEADSLRGRSAQQATQIERSAAELAHERAEANRWRTEAAQLKAAAAEHLAEIDRLRTQARELEQARTLAERERAVATAARAGLDERHRELGAREQSATRELAELRLRIEQVLEREGQLRAELAARESDLRAAQQAQEGAVERAKLEWQLNAGKQQVPNKKERGKKGDP